MSKLEQSPENEEQTTGLLAANTIQGAQSFLSSRSGVLSISAVSFLESALPLPILTDPFLMAAILANRANAIKLVIYTTISSVLGGVFAYFTALLFLDVLLQYLDPATVDTLNNLAGKNNTSTFLLTLTGAVTPIPYTIVAWAVAVLEGSLAIFIGTSILGRGFRYVIVGYCTHRFGQAAMEKARRYIGLTTIIVLALVALYVWYKM